MCPRLRATLYVLAALLLLLGAAALWLMRSFDGERVQRLAAAWMLEHHDRTLAFDGPLTLQLWPQPALAVQRARLSERGEPQQPFARIEQAALSLRMEPLLMRREIEIDSVSARGVALRLTRDAQGRRNIDDLLDLLAGSGKPSGRPLPSLDVLELAELTLDVDDAHAGVQGRLSITRLALGAFGPGRVSPLELQARAEFSRPALDAALELKAGLMLLPAPQRGAPPIVQLDDAALRLQGHGFELQGLDARLQAGQLRLEYGAGQGLGDSRLELRSARLQFGGTRLGWQVDSGELRLQQLRLDVQQRRLELEELALQLQGRRAATTLHARLSWPALTVQGDTLQGSAVEGALELGGDQRLRLQLHSQPPSGAFERITWPQLQADIDGLIAGSTVQGQAAATLAIEPQPLAATLDGLSLRLRFDDPALPAMHLALQGQAQLNRDSARGSIEGTINDQRVTANFDARLQPPRPVVDLQARFGTLDLTRFIAPARRGAAAAPAAAAMPIDLQPLRAADARLDIRIARLLRPPYRIDALELQAGVDDGRLTVRRLAGRAWGGRFEASGSADARSGALALRLRGDDVDLRALLADTTGYDGLRGRGRIDADLNSRGATVGAVRGALNGRVALALSPAALRGVDLAQTLRGWRSPVQTSSDIVASDAGRQTDFSQLEGSFELRNGIARNTDLDAISEHLRVGGEGVVDLVQGRLDYLLRARVVNTASGRAGPEMMMLNGVTVPVELHGPFGQVEWQVRWASVTAAVAALSVPNVARGAVGTAARGVSGVARGAAGVLRSVPGALTPPPR